MEHWDTVQCTPKKRELITCKVGSGVAYRLAVLAQSVSSSSQGRNLWVRHFLEPRAMNFPVFLAEHPCLAFALAIVLAASLLFPSLRFAWKRQHLLQRIPVPRPDSRILGHFKAFSNPQHHLKLREWALRCGPVYRIRLIYSPVVILTDPLAVATILRSGSGAEKPDQVYRTGDMVSDAMTQVHEFKIGSRISVPIHTTTCPKVQF